MPRPSASVLTSTVAFPLVRYSPLILFLMKKLSTLVLATGLLTVSLPQQAQAQKARSPYQTRFAVDAPITAGLAALSATGLLLVQKKEGLTNEQLAALNKNDIPKFDRFSAGYYSETAQTAGDLIVYPSLLIAPGLLALD